MARRADRARELHVRQAAYLRGRHNMSQSDIGRVLGGFSQAHVSRLLKLAEAQGYLVTRVQFVGDDLSEEDIAQLERLHEPRPLALALERLERREGVVAPRVSVFDSGSRADSAAAHAGRRRRFGKAAAGRLLELLDGARSVGVTWGSTVAGLIEGLGSLRFGPGGDEELLVVPVCAELLGLAAPEYSSSRLSVRLDEIVNRAPRERFSLAGVPAYIPDRYGREKVAAIREFVADAASYKAIFGGQEPLAERLDGLLTSVGSSEQPIGGGTAELLAAGRIDANTLRSLIVGDIGGALIARESRTPDERARVDELNAMWTGISLEHIRGIARRGIARDTPGCVVVAVGSERASVAFEVVRRGLVNEMLIDQDLAQALERLVERHLAR